MNNTLQIGWAEVDITPGKPIRLAGQFYERISEYVETPISATALAIENGADQVVFCSVDLESIDPCLPELVREAIGQQPGGPDPDKIVISATHTHTSFVYQGKHDPGLQALRQYLGEDALAEPTEEASTPAREDVLSPEEATVFLAERITRAVREAWGGRAPGLYRCAFGRAAVGMCRRVCYRDGSARMWGDTNRSDFEALEGGNDSGIELLFTYDKSRRPTGAVVNLSCPAQVLEQRYLVSSDFWGKVKILLRRELGEDFRVLALCAPAGDQCPRDLVRWVEPESPIEDPNVVRQNPPLRRADPSMYDVQGTWTIGRRIAGEILAVLGEAGRLSAEAELRHRALTLELPLRRVSEEENRKARQMLARFAAERRGREVSFVDSAAMHVYAGVAARFDRQQRESLVPCEIHVIRLGDVAFATSPFELFLDYANVIRARSVSAQSFLVQLACDSKGYLPTEKAEQGGHYSAYVSSGHVGHEGGRLLVERTLELIGELFRA